ncbi:MAG: hypothetical protein O7D91_20100 [Planctomycetota bacterium]|nr:hypothetical protein [Planctomycetota bacterium]
MLEIKRKIQDKFKVKIKRQDRPESGSYWELFELEREAGMNMTVCLQRIAEKGAPQVRQTDSPALQKISHEA